LNKKEIGAFIKNVRLQKKISKKLITDQTKLTRHQIICIEEDMSDYTFNSLLKYCNFLRIEINLKAKKSITYKK
jgi:transcriptional regulator with XRE-family HTH domain